MKEVSGYEILALQFWNELAPYVDDSPLTAHTMDETNALLGIKIDKINNTLQKPIVIDMLENISPEDNVEHKHFEIILRLKDALEVGDRVSAANIRNELETFLNPD